MWRFNNNKNNSKYSRIALYSLYNGDTTLGENMYKYKMTYKDWYSPPLCFISWIILVFFSFNLNMLQILFVINSYC